MSMKKFVDDEALTAAELNSSFAKSLRQTGQVEIAQLQDRAVTTTADGGQFIEAYTDSGGRNNSVQTVSTSAAFDTDKFEYSDDLDRTQGVPADNVLTTYLDFSSNFSGTIETLNNEGGATGTYDIGVYKNAVLQETLSSQSFTTGANTTLTFATPISVVPGDVIKLQNDSDSDTVFRASSSAQVGTYISSETTGRYPSGTTATGFTLVLLAGTEGRITHVIPTGTFSTTLSSAVFTFKAEDWESGADVQFKLTNSTEDTGWLDSNDTVGFTALTAEPDEIVVRLIPKSSSPTAGHPSINGIALYGDKP